MSSDSTTSSDATIPAMESQNEQQPRETEHRVLDASLLLEAIRCDDVGSLADMLAQLNTFSPNVRINKETRQTILMEAARCGSVAVARWLVEEVGADVNLADRYDETALFHATTAGNTAIVSLLISAKAAVGRENKGGQTPLMIAARNGHLETCHVIVNLGGADVNARDLRGWAPLLEAARAGHCPIVQFLLEKGARVNGRDEIGFTALMHAASEGYSDVCELLLENDANKMDGGHNAANIARHRRFFDLAKMIDQYNEQASTPTAFSSSRSSSESGDDIIAIDSSSQWTNVHQYGFFAPVTDPKSRRVSLASTRRRSQMPDQKALSRSSKQFATAPHVTRDMLPRRKMTLWVVLTKILTCCFCNFALARFGKLQDARMRQAWREKVALCIIIVTGWAVVLFVTFHGMLTSCTTDFTIPRSTVQTKFGSNSSQPLVAVRGKLYSVGNYFSNGLHPVTSLNNSNLEPIIKARYGRDISDLFPLDSASVGCSFQPNYPNGALCTGAVGNDERYFCHTSRNSQRVLASLSFDRMVQYKWDDIWNTDREKLFAYNGYVYDLTAYLSMNDADRWFGNNKTTTFLQSLVGTDATAAVAKTEDSDDFTNCLEHFKVGKVEGEANVCTYTRNLLLVMVASLTSVNVLKLVAALIYRYVLLKKMSRPSPSSTGQPKRLVAFVPCYNEGEKEMRGTLDSIASADYSSENILIFVVADGYVTGSGNDKPTPDIVRDIMDHSISRSGAAEPYPYISVGASSTRPNMAQVYTGHYRHKNNSVPMVLVVKCGTPTEQGKPRAGNRGKRDSQLILLQWLKKLFFNEALTLLEFELFEKTRHLTGVTADNYELLLMVDADTVLESDAISKLVTAMESDKENQIVGVCGETLVKNKYDSWWTKIQVFEYFIGYNLGKAYESVFGYVACLPGCFCMHRIYITKYDNLRVPIIINPDLLSSFGTCRTDTMHQKNLLLLGEDCYLTTLLVRTFPQRRVAYCANAVCHTVVPNTFWSLVSQRRRWINGNVHNMMELVMSRSLPGIACLSVQFAVLVEIIASWLMPLMLIILATLAVLLAFGNNVMLPLLTGLASTPTVGILAFLLSPRLSTLKWFFVYIGGLVIWSIVLPVYSIWHFDDFAWSKTHKKAKSASDEKEQEDRHVGNLGSRKWIEWKQDTNMHFHDGDTK